MSPKMSSHITLLGKNAIVPFINKYKETHEGELFFLDIGGRDGERKNYAKGFSYRTMDINPESKGDDLIVADICKPTGIPDDTYDVTFSHNMLEHVQEPWVATAECVRITKPGGLTIHIAPFAWRYHPMPKDNYRFSHSGLTFLFERTGMIKTLLCGYDIGVRRSDHITPAVFTEGEDVPPFDKMGGWRENWLTVYVGEKI